MPAALPPFFLLKPVSRSLHITAHFNEPRNYTFAPTKLQLHEGVDLAAIDALGNAVTVLAAQRGVVDKVAFSPEGYGNYARVVHQWGDETWVTWYGHMSSVTAQIGQFVQAGQKIGIAGTTGFSTGIHLHLTLQHIGHGLANYTVDDVVDPEPFFRSDPAPLFDDASFVADVTVPDGTVMKPGQVFEKVWRVRNAGTTAWGAGYTLAFSSGEQLGGPGSSPLAGGAIQPGQVTDLKVKLTAPAGPGRYRSVWRLGTPGGALFGPELYGVIEIKETRPYDEASYVADVSVEDGTVIQPGAQFVKTWRVRNTGTTSWDETYALVFAGDNRMDGPKSIPLTRKVKPGDFTELSVALTAPKTPGRYRSTWTLQNGKVERFKYDQYTEIQIPKLKATGKLNEMRWVADVTVPDETKMAPGERFTKTWRVQNSGTTIWGDGYTLAYFGDERMEGPEGVPLPPARPGDTVEVSVRLIAPQTPGVYRTTWKGRDAQGKVFEFDLFALIEVVKRQEPGILEEISYVADVTVPDGAKMKPGQVFVKTWRIRNTGTIPWGTGYTLAYFAEDRMDGPGSVPLPPAKPGETVEVSVTLKAPTAPGLHKSVWKGRTPGGTVLEHDLFALIQVGPS